MGLSILILLGNCLTFTKANLQSWVMLRQPVLVKAVLQNDSTLLWPAGKRYCLYCLYTLLSVNSGDSAIADGSAYDYPTTHAMHSVHTTVRHTMS